jgi:hypothetical protein
MLEPNRLLRYLHTLRDALDMRIALLYFLGLGSGLTQGRTDPGDRHLKKGFKLPVP